MKTPRYRQAALGDDRLTLDGMDFVLDSLKLNGIEGTTTNDIRINRAYPIPGTFLSFGLYNDAHQPQWGYKPDVIALPDYSFINPQIPLQRSMQKEAQSIKVRTIVPRSKRDARATQKRIQRYAPELLLPNDEKILLLSVNDLGTEKAGTSFYGEQFALLKEKAERERYTIVIATGPKTSEQETEELKKTFPPDLYPSYYWHKGNDLNPYPYFLHRADAVVVAGVTLSSLSDPINWGKPTAIIDLKPTEGQTAYNGKFAHKMTEEGFAERFGPATAFAYIEKPDPEKTGWPAVGRQLAEAARQKLADPQTARSYAYIRDIGLPEPKRNPRPKRPKSPCTEAARGASKPEPKS